VADRTGFVYKQGKLAASLTSSKGLVLFAYEPEYLESSLPAIATTLPKTSQAIELAGGATPAFFAGLLPEGQRLIAMKNRIKTSLSDELGLLLEIGADLIGDVQVLSKGQSPEQSRNVFRIPGPSKEISFAALRSQYFGSAESGLPGVQDKVSSKMLNAPVKTANVDYILKFNPEAVPFAVENEHFFLALAKRAGIKTAEFKLLTDSNGEHALRLRRFDRGLQGSLTSKFAQEDGAQVMNLYPAQKYEVEFLDMAQALISQTSAKPLAGLSLFQQLVFNWLICNGDAHAKNFSILKSNDGSWHISPAYDLLSTRFYDDRTMALPLFGKDRGWTRPLLVAAAGALSVPEKLAVKVLDKQIQVVREALDSKAFLAIGFPLHAIRETENLIHKRIKAIS
jgi:serine/threonine-protein kinase HipA